DVMVVVAYGLILPKEVIHLPPYGCINVHASLLPRWRGAAPIQSAILAGDAVTGITIMKIDEGLDTGDMLAQEACPIYPTDTAQDVHDRLAKLGAHALLRVLAELEKGISQPIPQENILATYAPKISKEDALIDWNLSAEVLE